MQVGREQIISAEEVGSIACGMAFMLLSGIFLIDMHT